MPQAKSTDTTDHPNSTEPYDRDVIFQDDGPINPTFVSEAIRTIFRAVPIDDSEPSAWSNRRMFCAMLGLSALNPRDEIEVMLGVQALSAYHAAAACWRIGMNHHQPNGDSTRHITTAASAARTFDSLLKALERRQAKPLAIPAGRPLPREWPVVNATGYIKKVEDRCTETEPASKDDAAAEPEPTPEWTTQDLAQAEIFLERERIEKENEGLDLANTEGILPGGGMILTDNPTPQQEAYMERRLELMYKREYEANLRQGIKKRPVIRGIRIGETIP